MVWAGLAIFTLLTQRRLIYFPPRVYPATPADLGIVFEEISISASDGVSLVMWWLPAEKETEAPAVICFHGNATNIGGMLDYAAVWRARGFSCLLAEYRGYGNSEGKPTEKGLYRDALAAYQWVLARGVKSDRIVVYGHSLGAAVAAWLAAEEPVAGVVLEGSFTSIHALARHHYWWLPAPEFIVLDKFLTAAHIARARCPVLVIHGEDDTVAPVRFGRGVFEAAVEPKTWCPIPGAGHNDLNLLAPQTSTALDEFARHLVGKKKSG